MFAFIAATTWWLSGYDSKLSGDNTRRDFIRRTMRCSVTILLLLILLALPSAETAVPVAIGVSALLALTWAWCLGDCFAHAFHILTGISSSYREYDPHENVRNLQTVAGLLKIGLRDEALQLAETLKASGGANVLALEALLERAGIRQETLKKKTPLAEAHSLNREGKFAEVETILKSLLTKNPSNVDAALMLIRVYVQDFRRSDKAMEVLGNLKRQPHIPEATIEYASRSIHEWGQKKEALAAEILPESIDELAAAGYLGTAIELAERTAKEEPEKIDVQLKVAEMYAVYSGDIQRAEKIIKRIEENPAFNAEQIQIALARLREWREVRRTSK